MVGRSPIVRQVSESSARPDQPTPADQRYGYFGPAGTFTHEALNTLPEAQQVQQVPYPTVPAALDAVRSGEVSAVLVPIENSVEGGVSATLDALTHGDPLVIVGEVQIPVRFCLAVRAGTTLEQVRSVITHPHAAAQCRGWLGSALPAATVTERGSTAGAAAEVARPGSDHDAAICSPTAARGQGLTVLVDGIGDNAGAETRFVLVRRPTAPPAPTGADKTTLVCFMQVNRAGGLLQILEQFAGRGVNLCRIESRPTRTTMGDYCFSIDAEGHLGEARMAETLQGLHRVCSRVVYLGSYPRADRVVPTVPPGQHEDDYAAAARWVADLQRP